MKHNPEKTLRGRLALMTDDRDHFRKSAERHYENLKMAQLQVGDLKKTIENLEMQLRWHRQMNQSLVERIPTAR